MPLVPAKCPECGGNINIDPAKKAGICEYCKQPFVVEEAIQNFNTTYNITNNNEIKADVVNVYENNKDFVIEAGVLKKYIGESIDVTIPNNVMIIGEEAFWGCEGVRTVIIPESVTEIKSGKNWYDFGWHSKGAFANCRNLKKVLIPSSLNIIGDYAFYNCVKLQELNLNNNITYIGDSSFTDCKALKKLNIPANIKDVSLTGCVSLQKIDLPEGIRTVSIHGCSNLRDINIPNGVETLDVSAGVTRIVIPYGVKKVKLGCGLLKHIDIPDSVEDINLRGCYSLEEVTVPPSVKIVSAGAFNDCKSLKKLILPSTVTELVDEEETRPGDGLWPQEMFRDCVSLVDVEISPVLLKKHIGLFKGTPFWRKVAPTLKYCPYCGGELKGLFTKICTRCGKEKPKA